MSHAILRDLPYLWQGSCYREDLGVYFHILEVKDHNNDITLTAMLTVDLKMQGHALFNLTFHISVCFRAIEKISVSISTLLISRIKMKRLRRKLIHVHAWLAFKCKVTHYFA